MAEKGCDVKEDARRGYRRVVASPTPCRVVEIEEVKSLRERCRSGFLFDCIEQLRLLIGAQRKK